MKVFIGWSGERSKKVALALRSWIPRVLQTVDPWMSEQDIPAGAPWLERIRKELQETRFGLVVVTRENQDARWLNFEDGALAKQVSEITFVCPYLIDHHEKTDLAGPLASFQLKKANRDDTFSIIADMNKLLEKPVADEVLRDTFDRFFGDLDKVIKELPPSPEAAVTRKPDELLVEILETVRTFSQELSGLNASGVLLVPPSLNMPPPVIPAGAWKGPGLPPPPLSQETADFLNEQIRRARGLGTTGGKPDLSQEGRTVADEPNRKKK